MKKPFYQFLAISLSLALPLWPPVYPHGNVCHPHFQNENAYKTMAVPPVPMWIGAARIFRRLTGRGQGSPGFREVLATGARGGAWIVKMSFALLNYFLIKEIFVVLREVPPWVYAYITVSYLFSLYVFRLNTRRLNSSTWVQNGAWLILTLGAFSGDWRYGLKGQSMLHDIGALESEVRCYINGCELIPGPGTRVTKNGVSAYVYTDGLVEYHIVHVPMDGGYGIKMGVFDSSKGGNDVLDYVESTPGAILGMTANYPLSNVNERSRVLEDRFKPAGLVMSDGKVLSPFLPIMFSHLNDIGEAILVMTKKGDLRLLKSPETHAEIEKEISLWQEAVQLGPILIWPDASGQGVISPHAVDEVRSGWGFVGLDAHGNLIVGTENGVSFPTENGLWFKNGHRTPQKIAEQILSWAKQNHIEITHLVLTDGGQYTSLVTKGMFDQDLQVTSVNDQHPSAVMVVRRHPGRLTDSSPTRQPALSPRKQNRRDRSSA